MPATREELQRRLDKLAADMPALIAQYPDPGDFNSAFSGLADDINDAASPADDQWVYGQIDQLLERFGLWRPGQDDLPPDE